MCVCVRCTRYSKHSCALYKRHRESGHRGSDMPTIKSISPPICHSGRAIILIIRAASRTEVSGFARPAFESTNHSRSRICARLRARPAVIYGTVAIIRILPRKSKFEMPGLRREIRRTVGELSARASEI